MNGMAGAAAKKPLSSSKNRPPTEPYEPPRLCYLHSISGCPSTSPTYTESTKNSKAVLNTEYNAFNYHLRQV